MITGYLRIMLVAAALCGAAQATAEASRVVVRQFDGRGALADRGRNALITLLADQHVIVNAKRWETALATAQRTSHGPASWRKAAWQSGVDAIIEGWVQDEGRDTVLTIAVRDATTGHEIERIAVTLRSRGSPGHALVTEDRMRQLHAQLRTVLIQLPSDSELEPLNDDFERVPAEPKGVKRGRAPRRSSSRWPAG
jgi:hypothetical protein